MRPTHPPRLAVFLLNEFATNESLEGDLHEEYLAGRSAAWYWRQVLRAVLVEQLHDFDPHDLFAPQSRFMQLVMVGLISVCSVFTVKLIGLVILDDAVLRMLIGPHAVRELLRVAMSFAAAVPIGIAIARLHACSRRAALVAFTLSVPLWAFTNVYVLDGYGQLESLAALPHVLAILVFISGMLSAGLHGDALLRSRRA
jgi:hypothetical protein